LNWPHNADRPSSSRPARRVEGKTASLSKECLLEKLFRDARDAMIENGANDTLALAASRSLVDSFR